jgi:DNA-binding LacI/PurR family transcriptional regulator
MEIKLHDPRVEFLRATGFPFSLIGHCADNAGISFVDFDFAEGLRRSVHYLAELGHRSIAYFSFPPPLFDAGFGPAVRSLEGFNTGLAETGLKGFLSASSYLPQDAADAFRTLMAEHPDITGVIVANETICAGTYQAAYELGLRISDNLSVIAIASNYAAEKTTPPVTSINLPAAEMGRIGTELLIDQLESGGDCATQLLLAAELVIRQSTGSCREKKGGEIAASQP